jgi:uncharacterized UBP type Zn finger protein
MFKNLVGKGHAEFGTGRQQDAREYLDHLMDVISRAERAAASGGGGGSATASVPALFKFQTEERIQCSESGMVRRTPQLALNAAMHRVVSCCSSNTQLQHMKTGEQAKFLRGIQESCSRVNFPCFCGSARSRALQKSSGVHV